MKLSVIAKVIRSVIVNDGDWLDAFNQLSAYKEIAEHLEEDKRDTYNGFRSDLLNSAREAMETNNYVFTAHIEGSSENVNLVEVDYAYQGKEFEVTNYFEEQGEYYVEMREI